MNTCLHIFLLSFFVVTFYYLRAAPQERTGYLSEAARIPDDVQHAVFSVLGRSDALKKGVCSLSAQGWEKDLAQPLQHALAQQAAGLADERKKHNASLRRLAYIVVFFVLAAAVALYYVNANDLRATEILAWNAATFVVFTAFELMLFTSVVSKYAPFTQAQEMHALAAGAGISCEAAPSASA